MDINEPFESEESNHSMYSLSCTTSSTIFHNAENIKNLEKKFFNRFMAFCEMSIFNNIRALQYDNDITETTTSEENFINQSINQYDFMMKVINGNDSTEKTINKSDFMGNAIKDNDFTDNPLNQYEYIENTINENNFIKKLMNEDDFIDKFLEKTTEKNANENLTKQKNTKANPIKKITYVNPKKAGVGKEKPKPAKIMNSKAKTQDEEKIQQKDDPLCFQCTNSAQPVAHVKMEVLDKLKQSTRKLIELLEEIQLKTYSSPVANLTMENKDLADIIRAMPVDAVPSTVDVAVNRELKKLQQHTKSLDAIHVEHEKDDCSVYKRLTRKCVCLNRVDYNDFIIHFNEDSKFFTSNTGEIIKNIRILKKFLYIGGDYSKRALIFLNEGLATSNLVEKIEIIQGCSHADLCNIFEEHSIVISHISWPCKSEYYGDSLTQSLTTEFILKLAQIEEGRRYLNYTSKISNDIKKVIRKKSTFLSYNIIEHMNSILNLLHPPTIEHISTATYYCKAVEEGFGFKTVAALARYRHYLTLEEVFMHLDLIHNSSKTDCGKNELRKLLPVILSVFRNLLFEFDNSEMNIILTNILNNIIPRNILTQYPPDTIYAPRSIAMAETITEVIEMKNESNQIPDKKNNKSKNRPRTKTFLMSTTKCRESSKRKIWELSPKPSPRIPFNSPQNIKKNRKESRNSVIVVPINKQKNLFWI